MKRKAALLAAGLAIVAGIQLGHTKSTAPQVSLQENTTKSADFVVYDWYYDIFYTDYTGVTASLASELARLRNTYSGYIFSASPGMGLSPFEFGSHPYYSNSIIYSNYY